MNLIIQSIIVFLLIIIFALNIGYFYTKIMLSNQIIPNSITRDYEQILVSPIVVNGSYTSFNIPANKIIYKEKNLTLPHCIVLLHEKAHYDHFQVLSSDFKGFVVIVKLGLLICLVFSITLVTTSIIIGQKIMLLKFIFLLFIFFQFINILIIVFIELVANTYLVRKLQYTNSYGYLIRYFITFGMIIQVIEQILGITLLYVAYTICLYFKLF